MAWILVSTFSGIPRDLDEAAYIDGATRMQALMRVIFPVAGQGIAVAGMYVWLNCWNEFTYALYLSLSTKTLPLMATTTSSAAVCSRRRPTPPSWLSRSSL